MKNYIKSVEEKLNSHIIALFCVCAISGGQIFFKLSGEALNNGLLARSLALASVSMLIYGLASIGWIYVLAKVPLSRVYPYMAMSFVVVPLSGKMLFQEELAWGDFVAMMMIVGGVLVAAGFGGAR